MSNPLLLVLEAALIGLDFLIMLLTFGWVGIVKKALSGGKVRSVPVGEDPSHRVNAHHADKLLESPFEGVTTLYELQRYSFNKYSSSRCMGSRVFLGQLSPKVKKFGPDVVWRSFREVRAQANGFGAALRAAGLVAAPEKASIDKIVTPCSLAIFENTCPEWMIAALGAFTQSIIVTTIYATLGMDAVVSAVNDGTVDAILCNKRNVEALVNRISEMPSLKTIVYTSDLVAPDEDVPLPEGTDSLKIVSFEDFHKSGDTDRFPPTPPKPATCAVIMYTSGSTGKPKGVVLTHANVLSAVAAGREVLEVTDGEEVYLGYLPLAHILELMAEFAMLASGSCICYADPKTLTATGASPVGALELYSPTMMAGVPKIWDVIAKGIKAKFDHMSPVANFLVQTAFKARAFAIEHGYDTPLFNLLVFKKFAKVVGGKMNKALSGGGPLNSEVQVFCRTAFGFPLFQGYGLTETTAGLAIQDVHDLRAGIAGVPLPCCQVKLDSCPEIKDRAGLPYMTKDRKDVDGNPIYGRGEIWIKGHNVALGYYLMPEKTKEEFPDDGWFKTGDIGQFMDDGSIRIVDRKKNLVKLKGGEYIAVENMESAYGNSSFVDAATGGLCCYGDGDMDRPVALMQLSKPATMKWAKENGVDGEFEDLIESDACNQAVLKDLQNEHKKAGLSHLEKLVAVALLSEPWTPENECLTAANKLNRRVIVQKFSAEFEQVRAKGIF